MKFDWTKILKSIRPDNVARWLTAIGGRRFWLSVLAGVSSTVLAWYGKITPEIFRDVTLGTVGLYIGGNTFQKVKQSTSETTVQVAEITGEAPVTNNIGSDGQPIKVELSSAPGSRGASIRTDADQTLGY